MLFKQLTLEDDLELYRHAIEKHIDVLLPLDYLKNGDVFGLFTDEGKLCGGFTIITKGPLRVLDSIPNFKGLTFDPTLEHTAEITGVWLCTKNKKQFTALKFWTHMIYQIVISRKKYFVYAYSSRKVGLKKIYEKTAPEVLFRGETKILPGMPAPDHESVEVFFKSRLLIQTLKNPDFFIKRLPLKKYRNKNLPAKNKDHYETHVASLSPFTSVFVELWGGES